MNHETDYQRAWRERGEAEYALRQWNRNQASPAFYKTFGIIGGLAGFGLLCAFVSDPGWGPLPMALLGCLFYAMPFLTPSILREQIKARVEAKETLQRLGVWKRVKAND